MCFIFILNIILLFFLPLSHQHKIKHFQFSSSSRTLSENECQNNGNKTDEINFNLCQCPKNFFGRYCEFNSKQSAYIEAVTLIDSISSISSSNSLKENETQTNILNLIQFKKQIKEININSIQQQKNVIEEFEPQNENEYNALLCLTGLVMTAYLEDNTDNNMEIVQSIINNINIKIQNINIGSEGFVIKQIPLQDIYFHKIATKKEFINKYINKTTNSSISYIDTINFIEDDSSYFYISKIPDYSFNKTNFVSINFKYVSDQLLRQKMNVMNYAPLYIYYSVDDFINSFSKEKVVFDKNTANFYYDIGIDIYNINDPAFNYRCYKNYKHYHYRDDLTQKFRKKNIYQNITFTFDNSINNGIQCPISDVNYTKGYIMLNCTPIISDQLSEFGISYGLSPQYLENETYNKVYELPLSCIKEITGIKGNSAIWFHIWFFPFYILSIIIYYSILICCCDNVDSSNEGEKNLFKNPNNPSTPPPTENSNNTSESNNIDNSKKPTFPKQDDMMIYSNSKNKDETNDISHRVDKEVIIPRKNNEDSFCSYYSHNYCLLHPFFYMSNHSWTTPLYFQYISYYYSFCVLTGFNAIYYNEDLIEQRLYVKQNRFLNNFINEMYISFCSILTNIVFVVCARLLIISYPSTWRSLLEFWEKNQHDKIQEYKKHHNIRVIISCVLMVVLSAFFLLYAFAFSDVYYKTNRGWLFNFLLSYLSIWLVFSPLHILFVSILEYKKSVSRDLVYYVKKLAFFS